MHRDWRRDCGSVADQVPTKYPVASFSTPRAALVAVTTDSQFTCPARAIARAAAANQSAPVYRYFFSQVMRGGPAPLTALGASHGLELYFVFQHLEQITGYTPTSSDTAVESAMLTAWSAMARSGQPNVTWPRYVAATDPFMEFGAKVSASQDVRTTECDFWDSL